MRALLRAAIIQGNQTGAIWARYRREMPWTLDGEKEDGHETVEVENLHHAIRLMQKKDEDA